MNIHLNSEIAIGYFSNKLTPNRVLSLLLHIGECKECCLFLKKEKSFFIQTLECLEKKFLEQQPESRVRKTIINLRQQIDPQILWFSHKKRTENKKRISGILKNLATSQGGMFFIDKSKELGNRKHLIQLVLLEWFLGRVTEKKEVDWVQDHLKTCLCCTEAYDVMEKDFFQTLDGLRQQKI